MKTEFIAYANPVGALHLGFLYLRIHGVFYRLHRPPEGELICVRLSSYQDCIEDAKTMLRMVDDWVMTQNILETPFDDIGLLRIVDVALQQRRLPA